jgi:DNA polymerase III gamma/tau subunit
VLDQVAAFGDGGVTVARVRELLGLVGDEAYCELLEVISERRAAAVFPLVARLVEAGEDLGAFVAGAAEVLRALLAATLAAEPEPMGAPLAAAVKDAAARLAPGDVLRMLRALAEAEEAIRRGPSPRLAVETLLARWVLMDRTVAIEDLLTRGPGSEPVGLERLKALWPEVVAAAQAVKPLLAQALAEVEPAALDGHVIRLRAVGDNPIAADGITRNRAAIATLLGRWLPEVSRVVLEPPEPGARAAGRPRGSASDARTGRTERLRAKNPALDAAIETLDLELLD